MKIKKLIEKTIEVEIQLPAYFRNSHTVFKIDSETMVHEVSIWDSIKAVAMQTYNSGNKVNAVCSYEQISEAEFMNQLNAAKEMIMHDLIPTMSMDAPIIDLELENVSK